MTRDPNSFEADIYACKREINKKQAIIEKQKSEIEDKRVAIDDLMARTRELETEINKILNSKGWKALDRMRKVIPKKKVMVDASDEDTITANKKVEYRTYNSHYEDNVDFSKLKHKPEVKALAFYLPQFHTFPENDRWWGKGFTEWTNTKKAEPRFEGHYQPREPHDDIGYYVLDNIDTIKKQVELAKQHGLYGFCFYYYWFSGKRLMEKPVDLFLEDKSIDFPFCLCWANGNFTKAWDGLNKDVLMRQEYKKSDPKKFIEDIKKYLMDDRYIRVDGKPVILVYDPVPIIDFEEVVNEWRKTAKKIGIGEIVVWSKNLLEDHDFKNADFVEGEFDFAPTGDGNLLMASSAIEMNEDHLIFDYAKYVDTLLKTVYSDHTPVKPFYYSCTMGWDNSPRRKSGYFALSNYSPEKFYEWLRAIIDETKRRQPEDKRFIFINAWNEWAEGTYLEPDKKYGYTNINTLSKAIYGLPYDFKLPKK